MNETAVVLRWLHVIPAVAAGGATFFTALAVLPTLRGMPEDAGKALRAKLADRWRVVVMISITLLLLSGVANFLLFAAPAHRGQTLYHALFGVKVILALVVFFLGSALTGRSPALQPIRDNAPFWVKLNAVLVLLVILVSGVLRNIPAGS